MKKAKTIRSSIRHGNILILSGGLFLTVFFTICLAFIHICQQTSVHYGSLLSQANDVIIEANTMFRTIDSIAYESDRTATTSLRTPNFDALYNTSITESGKVVEKAKLAKENYDEFKSIAESVLETNMTNQAEAQLMCDEELTDSLNKLTDSLHEISTAYNNMNGQASDIVTSVITFSILIGMICLVIMLIYSILISNRMAKTIAMPIVAVAEWAESLSMGADHIEKADMGPAAEINLEEIQRMVKAFTVMSDSIKENVDVVSKVANGDMTAFVNIRSSNDTLGKSLYKMVQSNDIMFAQITQIAKAVTDGTESIASAAKLLADSCVEQANDINDLQDEIRVTNELTRENAENASRASELSNSIHDEIIVSKGKMQQLVMAIKEIFEASEKVFGVISDIEDIANQTNLLAINASIEASRAGEAGKSFAVVASSVKELADKSADSATQTKNLIEDTMSKAQHGSKLSDETYTAFETIINSLEQVIDVSGRIAESGAKQQDNMASIKNTIDDISKVVSNNAASSEETAAMTGEITKNANMLKDAMDQFHLRSREPGKPYIPPAKKHDKEFVKVATENYNKFLKTPEGRKIAQQINQD
ncbi:MAG: methyl-accepting chemotaxis protein [Bacteroides sp.]|nr:methyl-accepting chemotaxis protein [Bacteroides sp.]